MAGGSLKDVLFVPNISMNLLFIYQIFHSSFAKTVEFSPHDVVIQNSHDPEMIVATRVLTLHHTFIDLMVLSLLMTQEHVMWYMQIQLADFGMNILGMSIINIFSS